MERFQRTEKILGDKLKDIENSSVMIIGIGGVGGYTAESIARMGVKKIILVDHDKIDITNINRQIIALTSTIGRYKVDVMKERILDINPNCEVICYNTFYNEENKDIISKNNPTFVVDAIDTISSKKIIIKECLENNIKFITCMGTGNKLDPSKLEIIDIRKTSYDPLAKVIRKWVKDEHIKGKVMTITSSEIPIKISDRTPGSISFVPSSAGLLITSYIVRELIK